MSDAPTEKNPFFSRPILNSPYKRPELHWELDTSGQPTQKILEYRRPADFVTPIPKPKKRRAADQEELGFDVGDGISTKGQQYETRSIINEVRGLVETWRSITQSALWQVTPETARLLQHWRHYEFGGVRPFFCQIEAAETAIWLTEVAPEIGKRGKDILENSGLPIVSANDLGDAAAKIVAEVKKAA